MIGALTSDRGSACLVGVICSPELAVTVSSCVTFVVCSLVRLHLYKNESIVYVSPIGRQQ